MGARVLPFVRLPPPPQREHGAGDGPERPGPPPRAVFPGPTLGPRGKAEKAAIADGLRRTIWPELEAGRIRSVTHATFPLERAREAHELMESSAHLGKILLTTGR